MAESIAERAKQQGEQQPTEEELFPMGSLEGDKTSLKTLIKPGQKVEATVTMRKGEVPMRGGLLDPVKDRKLMVTCEVGKVESVPVREEGKIVSWKARQHLRPIYVQAVAPGISGDIEAMFINLLKSDPAAAAKLHKSLAGNLGAELSQ